MPDGQKNRRYGWIISRGDAAHLPFWYRISLLVPGLKPVEPRRGETETHLTETVRSVRL